MMENSDLGASAIAETGSREPGLASRPGPSGFDPARIRNAALEEAAAIVESLPEQLLRFWDRPGGPPGNGYAPTTRADLAAAIRASKSQEGNAI